MPVISEALQVLGLTSSSVTVRWIAWNPTTDEGDPPLVGYDVYVSSVNPVNSQSTDVMTEMVDPRETSTTLRNLEADTLYEFRVASVREGVGGVGPPSPPTYAQTLPVGKIAGLLVKTLL